MPSTIQLISTDFDGTLVSHASDPVFDRDCMELIKELQRGGAIWAINTGRSVALLEEGLEYFDFPIQPDFILTSERDVFRPTGRAAGNLSATGTSAAHAPMPSFTTVPRRPRGGR